MSEFGDHLAVLGSAALLGGLIGIERELFGGWAGLRTHMMVAMASALFVQVGSAAGLSDGEGLSRILQGITAGIGFIGAGTILKLTNRLEIRGLTTASSIWLSAAVGTACGTRLYVLAAIAVALSLSILYGVGRIERMFPSRVHAAPEAKEAEADADPEAGQSKHVDATPGSRLPF